MTVVKSRVPPLFVYGVSFLSSATSPGIEWKKLPVEASSPSGIGVANAVQSRNGVLRSLATQLDKLLCLLAESGSGSGAPFERVLVEAASEFPAVDSQLSESVDISSAVATIRAALSLQVKELAAVLSVERPTIYAWMRNEAKPQPQNRTRIAHLLKYAKKWNAYSSQPVGTSVRNEFGVDGKSLVDLLTESNLNNTKIVNRMQKLAEREGKDAKGIHEIANERGIDLSTARRSQTEFDVLTGKPFAED